MELTYDKKNLKSLPLLSSYLNKHLFSTVISNASPSLQDILMFLITFFVIMLAFSCGVSYMFNYLTDGTGSSTGGVFTYFFWVLLQVGSMVLPCSPPHRGDRLQHWWCVHLQYFIWVILQVGSMVLHVLHLMVGTGSSTGGVFTYFFWVLLQVGSKVLPCSPPHGGDRLQHRWCLHLLLLGPSPGRLRGSSCSPSHRGDRLQNW